MSDSGLADQVREMVVTYYVDALGMELSAHVEMGNIGAAEHRYRTYRDLMQTELGEPPSPKMERLFQSLL